MMVPLQIRHIAMIKQMQIQKFRAKGPFYNSLGFQPQVWCGIIVRGLKARTNMKTFAPILAGRF